MNKWNEIMIRAIGIGLLLCGFVVDWKAALLVFIGCWIDNIIKYYKEKEKEEIK